MNYDPIISGGQTGDDKAGVDAVNAGYEPCGVNFLNA